MYVSLMSWCYHQRLLRYQVHHIVTNDPEHDPDIEHMPFFAISHRFFSSLFSTYYDRVMPYDAAARFFVRYQKYLYYPVLLLGRFNLYRLSFEYLFLGLGPRKGIAAWHRYLELGGLVVFWYWFGYGILYRGLPTNWDRFAYVMISHMVTMPLHVQITLSHFAMSTADLGITESFPQKMLRTTMDVDCSEWLDFIHGGRQFQVYTATDNDLLFSALISSHRQSTTYIHGFLDTIFVELKSWCWSFARMSEYPMRFTDSMTETGKSSASSGRLVARLRFWQRARRRWLKRGSLVISRRSVLVMPA